MYGGTANNSMGACSYADWNREPPSLCESAFSAEPYFCVALDISLATFWQRCAIVVHENPFGFSTMTIRIFRGLDSHWGAGKKVTSMGLSRHCVGKEEGASGPWLPTAETVHPYPFQLHTSFVRVRWGATGIGPRVWTPHFKLSSR